MAFLSFSVWLGNTPGRNFYLTTQGKPAVLNGQLAKPFNQLFYRNK
jgi:hypothetical protein